MTDAPRWVPGSFVDNLNAAAIKVGYRNLPLAFGLARVPWQSTKDRDAFLDAITNIEAEVE